MILNINRILTVQLSFDSQYCKYCNTKIDMHAIDFLNKFHIPFFTIAITYSYKFQGSEGNSPPATGFLTVSVLFVKTLTLTLQ